MFGNLGPNNLTHLTRILAFKPKENHGSKASVRCAALVLALLLGGQVSPARAQYDTYQVERPEGAPAGFFMHSYRACKIVSSGGAPDAKLDCDFPAGWKLTDPRGQAIFPDQGLIPYRTNWAFSSEVGLFDMGSHVTALNLASLRQTQLTYEHVLAVPTDLGLDVLAWVWTSGREAAWVNRSGEVKPFEAPTAFLAATADPDPRCRLVRMIASLDLANLKSRDWLAVRRLPRPPAPGHDGGCPSETAEILAGQDAFGWRWLDPATLKARDNQIYGSPKAILARARTLPKNQP